MQVFFSSLLWVIMLLTFMTFVFKWQETTWTYEQSIYFSFITMTTIGFGDYVPAQVRPPFFKFTLVLSMPDFLEVKEVLIK